MAPRSISEDAAPETAALPGLRGESPASISEILERTRKEDGPFGANHLFPGVSLEVLRRREEERRVKEGKRE
jgi:hypothetical protein